ncbi:hypothetical protein [Compostimonas suwonensis]|uniref:hypothetical protein n=1 Tax=Compostimonas suwonensis TaxID=1048394 RepID=UPI001FEBC463|nr:hypothetical protein [Compostimonas suwonensis]
MLEWVVQLPRPLCRSLSGVLLLGTPDLDALSCLGYREIAQLLSFSTTHGGSRSGVPCVAVRLDNAHPEAVRAYSLGSVLADQQRQPFLLVPPECRFPIGDGGLDGPGGVGHARGRLGALGSNAGRPFRETVRAARRGAPFGADLLAQALSVFGRGAVLGTGLTPAEPAHGGESGACSGFALDRTEIGFTVVCGLGRERPSDLGPHSCSLVFGRVERGNTLVVLRALDGSLGVESFGDLFPPFRLPPGTFGFVVEACEFFGDELDRAITDKAAHRFFRGSGSVVNAPVSRVTFHRVDELCSRLRHALSDDVQPVGLPASGHADVDA